MASFMPWQLQLNSSEVQAVAVCYICK